LANVTLFTGDNTLAVAADLRAGELRSPGLVMQPTSLGAARLTKHSFSRSMLRHASRMGWSGQRTTFDMDELGQGEVLYEISTNTSSRSEQVLTFVGFTQVIDEADHTDRVIGGAWEITGALVDGPVDAALMDRLREDVPRQERGRFGPNVLVLTRGNRSVRFFESIIDRLAAGRQPDPDHVADAGYLMRSTAFYGNGKFGMRSFEGYDVDHAVAVPYRAQMLCAWLYRELSYDVIEHCARAKGGQQAVGFDKEWRRYFGLGNATGLGLVPYAMKHPRVINAWIMIRELALADVRSMVGSSERVERLQWWIDRARRHFASASTDDAGPFLSPRQIEAVADEVATALDRCTSDQPFDELYRWAEQQKVECRELVVSLLIELHEADDAEMDRLLVADEASIVDAPGTAAETLAMLRDRFGWLDSLDLEGADADHFWWVLSDNNEEPRRVRRSALAPEGRDLAVDVAVRMRRFERALEMCAGDEDIESFLTLHPEHRFAHRRLLTSDRRYGEPRDNVCDRTHLPLQLQRFQLAMYGMDNFKPKSTDWLRVTLFQGAPRLADLAEGHAMKDDWVLPARPEPQEGTHA